MMPAVNYEPAGVMARIKKLDIGSLFKKKKKPHCVHLRDYWGIVEIMSLIDDLTTEVKERCVDQQIKLHPFPPL